MTSSSKYQNVIIQYDSKGKTMQTSRYKRAAANIKRIFESYNSLKAKGKTMQTRRYKRVEDATTRCGPARKRQSVSEISVALVDVLNKIEYS